MKELFILHHNHGDPEDETYKRLGVFNTEEQAKEAVEHYLELPGFRDYPSGFEVSKYVVGKLYWPEGFLSVTN